MRFEIIAVGLSFAATSLFWFVSALRMSAANYGHMMQLQAFLLIVVAVFSLRTYDLVFYLHNTHFWTLKRSFKFAQKLEVSMAVLSVIISFFIWQLVAKDANSAVLSGWDFSQLLLICLANMSIVQGAAMSYLRALHLDSKIAVADFLTSLAWLSALAWLFLWHTSSYINVLTAGFAAGAVRPIVLKILVMLIKVDQQDVISVDEVKPFQWRNIIYVLLSGQLTNMLKNNLISLETLLLGRLVSAESVAVFRIARSFLNLSTVFLNISYQKTLRELAVCSSLAERKLIVRQMTQLSLKLWMFSLPIMFSAAFMYSFQQNSPSYDDLMLVLVIATIFSLPVVLQNSDFICLYLGNRFSIINLAYIIGFLLLVLSCILLVNQMSLILFMFVSGFSNIARFIFMRYNVARGVHD